LAVTDWRLWFLALMTATHIYAEEITDNLYFLRKLCSEDLVFFDGFLKEVLDTINRLKVKLINL